ncbi:hypothetical protein WICMUC_002579 [Wickerhamomyces mucosus]|uniref:PCI domain-containing protein n=1 Tax=Wickerhamomyces mucosus TaxID=1378264 RepID=A0A9P8PP18_9ASCO|nr:hypothetical protein WICMUC_002579 [Wickerhamomyces mucosus]
MSLSHFLQQLRQICENSRNNENGGIFNDLLSIDLNKESTIIGISNLQNDLIGQNDDQITQVIESLNLFDGDWGAFNSLAIDYLKLCRDFDPWSILKSHDLFLQYYNSLTISLLNNQFGNNLAILMFETTKYLVPLMKRLDVILNANVKGKQFKRLIFLSTNLTKLFNHLRALKGQSQKKKLIIFIVNNLNKIYFIISNPLLCANIFANMNLANLKLHGFPKSQQVEYRYILGRFYLIKNQLHRAYHHLNWSFQNSNSNEYENNIKILRYLIPTSLLVGKIPSKRLLSKFPEFQQLYIPLIRHLVNGNHFEFQQHLKQNESYFKSKKLLILLAQKSKIIIFRNLFSKVTGLTNAVSRLYFSHLQLALMKSIRSSQEQISEFGDQYMYQLLNESIDFSFVENIAVSLIENGLIRGNNIPHMQLILIPKTNTFPDIFQSYSKAYPIPNNESWMDL